MDEPHANILTHLNETAKPAPNEGLKLVLLLFHRAGKKIQNRTKTKQKKQKQILIHRFLFHWGCTAFSRLNPQTKRNGDIVVKQRQQQQQAVVRTAQG